MKCVIMVSTYSMEYLMGASKKSSSSDYFDIIRLGSTNAQGIFSRTIWFIKHHWRWSNVIRDNPFA